MGLTTKQLRDQLDEIIEGNPEVAHKPIILWVRDEADESIAVQIDMCLMNHKDGTKSPILGECVHVMEAVPCEVCGGISQGHTCCPPDSPK